MKYNLNSHRNGSVPDHAEKYSTDFTIDTQAENKIGLGIQSAIGKEFSIKSNKFSIGLYYDTDLSKWRYPTNFELEEKNYYSLRNHNFSLLLSWIL